MTSRITRALARDDRGAALVEFGFVAPVMALFLVGAFDIGHTLYMRGVLQGVVQKTARDSGLEDSTNTTAQTTIDNKVRDQVLALASNATVTFSRRYYRTLSDAAAAQAEPFPGANDTNHNGVCDNNEAFTDINSNGTRDLDGADDGQGGASDKTLYTVKISYPRMLPLDKFIGGSDTTTIVARTILSNQPYTEQAKYGAPTTGHCNP